MSRMARIVALRRLQEESKAMAVGLVNAKIAQIKQGMDDLDQATDLGRVETLQDVANPMMRLPPLMYERFLEGQGFRKRQLQEALKKAEAELEQVMKVWHGARILLQQAEKLAEHEQARLQKELNRKAVREMDMVATTRFGRGEGSR